MNPISFSCLLKDYWKAFPRNIRKIEQPIANLLFLLPLYLLGVFRASPWEFLFMLPYIFTALSVGTHLSMIPPMFYLLPMSSGQREKFLKRMLGIQVLVPCVVNLVWALLFANMAPCPAFAVGIMVLGSLLSSLITHLSYLAEKKHGQPWPYICGFITIAFYPLLSVVEDCRIGFWVILPVMLLILLPLSLREWKKFEVFCRARANYENILSGKVEK